MAVSKVLRRVRALREPVAVRTEVKGYGFIYRELPPDLNRLTPGFSLRPGAVPYPALVGAFGELAFGQGLIGDLHRQNVLFTPRGEVVLRDLDAFKCDPELRALKGLVTPPGLKADDRGYHRARADELRAEWPSLEQKRIRAGLDALLFQALDRHLGPHVVAAEREHLQRKGWRRLFHPRDPSTRCTH